MTMLIRRAVPSSLRSSLSLPSAAAPLGRRSCSAASWTMLRWSSAKRWQARTRCSARRSCSSDGSDGSDGGDAKALAAFSQVDVRVGFIQRAWEHEEADRLYCEEIDCGEDAPREIASGLRAHYGLAEMQGRRCLLLANIKPAKLAGFPSKGMVLCAVSDCGTEVEFVEPPLGAEVGERVVLEEAQGVPCMLEPPASAGQMKKHKHWNVAQAHLATDGSGIAMCAGVRLVTSAGPCTSGILNAAIC